MARIRQTIPSAQVRAGVRPGTTTTVRQTTTTTTTQQQDKRLAQIVDQGGVGVWKVTGNDAPIYALSEQQARDEVRRRGLKPDGLSLRGYVKLSASDRERLQQMDAARPRTMEDIRVRTAKKETARRGRIGKESSTLGTPSEGFSEKDREFIESRGGVIGVISEAEAAKMEAASKSNVTGYAQGAQESASKTAAKYVEQKPWRHTTIAQVNWARMVAEGGKDETRKVLRQLGYSGADVNDIISSAVAQNVLAPYTDAMGRINIIEAVRGGVATSTLAAAGIDDDTIADARYYASIIAKVAPQEKAPVPPLTDRLMMHVPASPPSVEKYAKWTYRTYLEPYKVGENEYNVQAALDAGVDPLILQKAGIDNLTILKASYAEKPKPTAFQGVEVAAEKGPQIADPSKVKPDQQEKAAGMLSGVTMLPYRNRDGSYDLVRMVEGGKVSAGSMLKAGFTEQQVTAAINTAMQRSASKWSKQLSDSMKNGAKAPDALPGRVTTERAASIAQNLMMHADPDLPAEGVIMPRLQQAQQWLNDNTKGTSPALRVAGGVAAGFTFALMPAAMLEDVFLTHGAEAKASKTASYAKGTANYFLTLPAAFLNDPYWTIGEVAGMVAGPKSVVRAARTARVWVDPYGVPARAVGIEFSCGKLGIKGHNTLDLGMALAEAQRQVMRGKLSGTVRVGGVEVKYRGTPIQHTVGEVTFSATPDITPFAGKKSLRVAEGGLYTSPYLAQRFMAASGVGTAATKPGVVAILTDAARVRNAPKSALKRVSEAETHVLRADQGLMSPAKIWRYQFETEITASPGTTFSKPPGNLRTRILGEKAGDFFVQYDGPSVGGITKGQLVPVHVYLDQGVYRTAPSPSALYAAKLLTIYESLKDVGQKVRHPSRTVRDMLSGRDKPGIREVEAQNVRQNIALVREIEAEARANTAKVAKADNLRGEAAYRKALVDAYTKRVTELYEQAGRSAEEAYQRSPERFEAAYRERLESNLRVAARTLTLQRAYEVVRSERPLPEVSVAQLPRWMREEQTERSREDRAEEGREETARASEERAVSRPRTERTPVERTARETTVHPEERIETETEPRRLIETGTTPRRTPVPETDFTDGVTRKRKASVSDSDEHKMDSTGRVQWKQGAYWIMVEPPPVEGERQRNVQYSRRPFWGVRKVKGNPEETFAKQGKPPKEFLYEMGVTKARIFSYEKPHLRWRQTSQAKRRRGRVI